MLPHEVFLSHASLDAEIAERVTQVLRDHGVPTFFSPANVVGAQQWQDEILQGLKRCDWFIVLLSPNAINSMWVKRETAFAMRERRYENRIVPLLYRDCDLGPLEWLTIFQIVDFRGKFEEGCRELLRVWGVGFKE
jgi:TIR domain